MAVDRKSGDDVAVKIIDRSKSKTNSQMIDSEISIMKRVSHPNIVKLIDDIQTSTSIFLILELVRGGDLFDTITETGPGSQLCDNVLLLLTLLSFLTPL